MSFAAIAERYARAVFELGQEGSNLDSLSQQIADFAELYAGNQELRDILDNPLVEEHAREALLTEVASRLNLSETALNTLRLLAQRHRLRAVGDIARRLGTLADDQQGVLRATVITAQPMPEAYYQRLTAELERSTNKRIKLAREEDTSLIAGVITKIGDNTIDGSLRGRLQAYGQQLMTGA